MNTKILFYHHRWINRSIGIFFLLCSRAGKDSAGGSCPVSGALIKGGCGTAGESEETMGDDHKSRKHGSCGKAGGICIAWFRQETMEGMAQQWSLNILKIDIKRTGVNLFPCPLWVDNSLNYRKWDPGETSVNLPCVEGSKSMKLVFFGGCGISMNGDGHRYSWFWFQEEEWTRWPLWPPFSPTFLFFYDGFAAADKDLVLTDSQLAVR